LGAALDARTRRPPFGSAEYELIAVFTGWNIYGGPTLDAPHALQKVIDSVR
jgi:hypothetical protein